MSINMDISEVLILLKKTSNRHISQIISTGNICFMLERKSFSDSKRSEVFGDILLSSKQKNLVLSYSTSKVVSLANI